MTRHALIALRRDTAANWTSTNPTLDEGEPGFETDTGKLKFGDGTTAWNSLPYFAGTLDVTDGSTTVSPTTTIDFTTGATVTDAGAGVAEVAISSIGTGAADQVTPPARIWREAVSPTTPTAPTTSTVISDGFYNAFPALAVTKFGKLICTFRSAVSHASVDGGIVIRTSDDGGATWSASTTIGAVVSGHDLRDPAMICTNSGRLIIIYFDWNGSAVVGLKQLTSDDGGTTWTGPTAITMPHTDGDKCSGQIFQHSTGVLILPIYGQNTGDTDLRPSLLFSTDDGDTWGNHVDMAGANSSYGEVWMVELADRSLLAFARRMDDTPNKIHVATSTDVGQTWSSFTALSWTVNGGRSTATLIPVSQALFLFYRKVTSIASVWRYSFDYGATWSAEQTFSSGIYNYAGGCALEDDLIGMVVAAETSSSDCRIYFSSYRVTAGATGPTGAAGGALDGSYPNPGLASSVAGAGLAETSDVLSVNVDSSTIEINTDTLRVKDAGVTEAKIGLSDVTTNNASTSNHGFLKKLDNNAAHFMDGQGNWSTPTGGSTWSVLTNPAVPDLIFDGHGDVIMVQS